VRLAKIPIGTSAIDHELGASTVKYNRSLLTLFTGVCIGVAVHAVLFPSMPLAIAQLSNPQQAPVTELEAIKGKLPDQSHVMQDVSYHFSNLWFAGKHENWDLANFYWSETRSHLHWAVRIIPVRKDNAGVEVKLEEILQGMENGPLKQLGEAIAAHNHSAFEKTYRTTMETCYGCHKAAAKPFLRLQIPAQPESPIINFDPNADLPR
jgi:hypothetical protein